MGSSSPFISSRQGNNEEAGDVQWVKSVSRLSVFQYPIHLESIGGSWRTPVNSIPIWKLEKCKKANKKKKKKKKASANWLLLLDSNSTKFQFSQDIN